MPVISYKRCWGTFEKVFCHGGHVARIAIAKRRGQCAGPRHPAERNPRPNRPRPRYQCGLAFWRRLSQTSLDFFPKAVDIPHEMVDHLLSAVGKAMDLLHRPLAAVPAAEHQTAALRAKIYRHHISSHVHCRNASTRPPSRGNERQPFWQRVTRQPESSSSEGKARKAERLQCALSALLHY